MRFLLAESVRLTPQDSAAYLIDNSLTLATRESTQRSSQGEIVIQLIVIYMKTAPTWSSTSARRRRCYSTKNYHLFLLFLVVGICS